LAPAEFLGGQEAVALPKNEDGGQGEGGEEGSAADRPAAIPPLVVCPSAGLVRPPPARDLVVCPIHHGFVCTI
jgi:hypothetical protein